MSLPHSILAPTDFSDPAESAVDYAFALARACDAKVHLLHVYSLDVLADGLAQAAARTADHEESAHALFLDAVSRRQRLPQLGQTLLRRGDPRELIVQVARALPADLIVMGSYSRRDLSSNLTGSVLDAVLRCAPCPVLAVHPPKLDVAARNRRFHHPPE
jgi:nucleotide-binding universal stress UspA family protein